MPACFRRADLAADGGARVPVHRIGEDDQGRPARPFLAGRAAAVPRTCVRPRQHDPRRAGAASRRPASATISSARWRGRRRSTATTPMRRPAAISSPPTTPKAWSCARTRPATTPRPIRTRSPRRTWCGFAGLPGTNAWRRQVDRLFDGAPAARGREPVHACRACSTRSTCGCAWPRSSSPARAPAADALVATALKLPFLDRIVVRAPSADALPPLHPAVDKVAAVTEPAAFVCAAETCSLPVTTPEQIAATLHGDARRGADAIARHRR